jgi:hypothetical protein
LWSYFIIARSHRGKPQSSRDWRKGSKTSEQRCLQIKKGTQMKFVTQLFVLIMLITSGTALAEFSWNSRTDCYGELRTEKSVTAGWGRWSKTYTVYLPPNPSVLSLCNSVKAADSVYELFAAKRGVYGNFCGGGWRSKSGKWLTGGQTDGARRQSGDYKSPINQLDAHCKAHDWCYIDKHTLSLGCDLKAMEGFCNEARRDIGDSHITQQASGMCAAWSAIVVPLASRVTPPVVAFCKVASRFDSDIAKSCRGI